MTSIEPKNYVGFDTITRQIERRLLKRGFQLNLMVVGQSGLGKSTLINTLFASQIAHSHGRKSADEPVERTPEIQSVTHTIVENDVRLQLTVIDTPGYGDQMNNDKCWEPIVKYIKDQHSLYLRKELTAQRDKYLNDTRVHCVLFFIQPNGHGLKPLDVVVLKKLSEIANVVPVIAKSDTMTLAERESFKAKLQAEFAQYKLRLYPYASDEYDVEEREYTETIRNMIPFAVVGSSETATIDGKEVPVRHHRWGTVNVENTMHCEFVHLRSFLITTHLQDLIDTTAHTHYESFRSKQLLALKENSAPRKRVESK
ncbi:Cell division control protein 10 [Wickerhamiella sorbophila]|uniref:Cell division control protein 10 n=1 Tax=Wickerhamiella sorbophila TaxID=45607 RepID=A0A2T0FCA3_9ASCO|nr:Cell division control protein 10 [Wickerhamiella sorbophila]PRT52626.1 Cell division control protein 10 [Wickerhamiella sorbophila]